jgi:hypothetical protein
MTFDANNAYNHIAKLSSWRRKVGTQGEEQAKTYIKEQFSSLGFEVEEQSFDFSNLNTFLLMRVMVVLIAAMLVIAAHMLAHLPWTSSLIAGAAILIGCLVSQWSGFTEKLSEIRTNQSSSNIIARNKSGQSSRHLVFLAHYDSKSQTVTILTRSLLFLAFTASSLIIALGIILLAFITSSPEIFYFIKTAAWVPAVFAVLLLINKVSNKSDGAIDNASGVGMILELARTLKNEEDLPIDFTFVATGAEEVGLIGATHFIKQYEGAYPKDSSWFVNFDSVGMAGPIQFTDRYGLPRVRTSKELIKIVSEIMRQKGQKTFIRSLPIGVGTDQIPIGWRGFEAITIACRNIKMAKVLHSSKDTIDNISIDALKSTGEFVLELVEKIKDKK